MAENHPAGEPDVPVLDLAFDSGTLDVLRAGVKAHACAAGLPEDRAEDVVLAVHELAANAVCHGAGAGRLRIWKRSGALTCQVEDGDAADSTSADSTTGDSTTGDSTTGDSTTGGPASDDQLPSRPGHGLWLVRQVADRMRVLSGVRGTRAMIAFDLPARRTGQGCLPA